MTDETPAESTPTPSTTVVMTTTWSRRRQHYALPSAMRPAGRSTPGLRGPALCNTDSMPVEAYDQTGIRAALIESAHMTNAEVERIVVSQLPACSKCEKAVTRMNSRRT